MHWPKREMHKARTAQSRSRRRCLALIVLAPALDYAIVPKCTREPFARGNLDKHAGRCRPGRRRLSVVVASCPTLNYSISADRTGLEDACRNLRERAAGSDPGSWRRSIVPPALDRTVRSQATGVKMTHADGGKNPTGRGTRSRRPSVLVVPPAFHDCITSQRAGVGAAGADLCERPIA